MRRLLLLLGLLLVRANGADIVPFAEWSSRLTNGLAGTRVSETKDDLHAVLKAALDSAPASLTDRDPEDGLRRCRLLGEFALQILPPSHPFFLALGERQVRVGLNLRQADMVREALIELLEISRSGQRELPAGLAELLTEDAAVWSLLMGSPGRASFALEDLLLGLDPKHPEARPTAQRLYNYLGAAYRELGRRDTNLLAQSEKMLWQSLGLTEEIYGTNGIPYTAVADNVARLLLDQHLPKKAAPWAEAAHRIRTALMVTNHPDLAAGKKTLARVRVAERKYGEAFTLCAEALPVLQDSFGPTSEETVECLQFLALTQFWLGNTEQAVAWAERLERRQKMRAFEMLTSDEETDRQTALRRMMPLLVPGTLASNAPVLLANALSGFKGVVARSLFETQQLLLAHSNSIAHPLAQRWEARRLDFMKACRAEALGRDHEALPVITQDLERLEAQIAAAGFTVGTVRRSLFATNTVPALPANTALVDYFLHSDVTEESRPVMRCDAVLHLPGRKPEIIRLPDSDALPKLVAGYPDAMSSFARSEPEVLALLTRLRELVWDPVAERLPSGTTNICISPEGPLNFVSWTGLVKGDRLLGEQFSFRYIPGTGDLWREKPLPPSKPSLRVFVDPDFDRGTANLNPASLRRLTNTAIEGEAVAKMAQKRGWDVELFAAGQATKANLQAVRSPWMLLIGTHGFHLPSVSPYQANDQDPETFNRPLKSTGLALAGANVPVPPERTEDGRAAPTRMYGGRALVPFLSSSVPVPDPDGYLTALEAGSLDLRNTWLVILSACDSGRGEFGVGEGVFGLPRAFLQAGAQNLLLTLWPVDDQIAAELMPQFAEEAMRSGNPSASLAQVQGRVLQRWRKSYGLVGAARRVAPYVLLTRQL